MGNFKCNLDFAIIIWPISGNFNFNLDFLMNFDFNLDSLLYFQVFGKLYVELWHEKHYF